MKCKTSNWSCVYHACMSGDCQKKEVLKNGVNWGNGKCKTDKMKAFELKPGQEFKLPGQRKFRTAHQIFFLKPEFNNIPPVGAKVLIILDGCRQLSLLREEEVILK